MKKSSDLKPKRRKRVFGHAQISVFPTCYTGMDDRTFEEVIKVLVAANLDEPGEVRLPWEHVAAWVALPSPAPTEVTSVVISLTPEFWQETPDYKNLVQDLESAIADSKWCIIFRKVEPDGFKLSKKMTFFNRARALAATDAFKEAYQAAYEELSPTERLASIITGCINPLAGLSERAGVPLPEELDPAEL